MFPLSNLLDELLILTINKLNSVSFVRIRRSCKFINEFTKKNQRYLNIHPSNSQFNGDCQITLTSSIHEFRIHADQINVPYDRDQGIYVVGNGFKLDGSPRMAFKLLKKNLPTIRAAISGFYFPTVAVWRYPQLGRNKGKFDKALAYFLELLSGRNPVSFIGDLSSSELEKFTREWKIKSLRLSSYTFPPLDSHLFRGCREIYCNLKNLDENVKLVTLLRNKRLANVTIDISRVDEVFFDVIKEWQAGTVDLEEFMASYVDDGELYNKKFEKTNWLLQKSEGIYIRSFQRQREKLDYWLCRTGRKWRLISSCRFPSDHTSSPNLVHIHFRSFTELSRISKLITRLFPKLDYDVEAFKEKLKKVETAEAAVQVIKDQVLALNGPKRKSRKRRHCY